MAIGCGALIGGVVSAATGFGIGWFFYSDSSDEDVYPTVPIILAIYGFLIGLVFCSSVLMVIASAVIALFVCYAEDPATINANHPEEYQNLSNAKPQWAEVYRTYGGGNANPIGPSMVVQPAQQQVVYQQTPSQTYAAAPIMNVQPQQAATEGGNTVYPKV